MFRLGVRGIGRPERTGEVQGFEERILSREFRSISRQRRSGQRNAWCHARQRPQGAAV